MMQNAYTQTCALYQVLGLLYEMKKPVPFLCQRIKALNLAFGSQQLEGQK